MYTRQRELLLPDDTIRVQTSRRAQPLWLAAGITVLAMTLAACESANSQTDTDPHATPAAETARQGQVTNTVAVQLPDLTDPAARKQFACSFEDGYFGEPAASRDDATSDCR